MKGTCISAAGMNAAGLNEADIHAASLDVSKKQPARVQQR